MRRHFILIAGLAGFLLQASLAQAESPPPARRLIPAEADLLLEVKNVRQIHDLILDLEVVKELQKFPNTREFFSSTQARRFFQFLAYYEKEMGSRYPELLDSLTAGGVALGVKLGPKPAPALLVIQGKDAQQTRKFVDLVLNGIDQELQRQEAKQRPEKITLGDTEVIKFGNDVYLATVGSAILISNKEAGLQLGLNLARGQGGKSLAEVESVQQAYRLLPSDLLAAFWLNMETIRKAPGAAAFYSTPREPFFVVTLGPYLDVLGRTPFVCGGVARTPKGIITTIRVPCGREGMGAELPLHLPPDPGTPAGRPLLQPKGVLYSDSNYFDLARIWNDRDKLFAKDAVKALEEFNKNSGKIPLPGLQISQLLTNAGAYRRTVVVNQPRVGYKVTPKTSIPAFAFVLEMRDPAAFRKTMEGALRGAGFLASTQLGLKMTEEKHRDVPLVGYRFPEDKPLRQDVNDIRFNFSPCFCSVGNQFVASSTIKLGKELIELLQAEAGQPAPMIPSNTHRRFFSAGVAEILQVFEDQLVAQAILDQALPAGEAREQVKAFIALLRKQGMLNFVSTFGANETRFEISITK